MHEVSDGLFCGTQPRNPDEVQELALGHGVRVIMNLQQDKDIEYWGIDFGANQQRCQQLGVTLLRKPVRGAAACWCRWRACNENAVCAHAAA
jgi:hypothetical protein